MDNFSDYRNIKNPFIKYLEFLYNNDYAGPQAEISRSCSEWIDGLTPKELIEHANKFSFILLKDK